MQDQITLVDHYEALDKQVAELQDRQNKGHFLSPIEKLLLRLAPADLEDKEMTMISNRTEFKPPKRRIIVL